MITRLTRAARLMIALCAVYGFVLHGFSRDALATARLEPDRIALCGPDAAPHDKSGQGDAAEACVLHCLGAVSVTALPASPPVASLKRQAGAVEHDEIVVSQPVRSPQRLAFARGPPAGI